MIKKIVAACSGFIIRLPFMHRKLTRGSEIKKSLFGSFSFCLTWRRYISYVWKRIVYMYACMHYILITAPFHNTQTPKFKLNQQFRFLTVMIIIVDVSSV